MSAASISCAGCRRRLEPGDRYIEDAMSGFLRQDVDPDLDAIAAGLLGGHGGRIVFCEDCTQGGGDYDLETFRGDEESEL